MNLFLPAAQYSSTMIESFGVAYDADDEDMGFEVLWRRGPVEENGAVRSLAAQLFGATFELSHPRHSENRDRTRQRARERALKLAVGASLIAACRRLSIVIAALTSASWRAMSPNHSTVPAPASALHQPLPSAYRKPANCFVRNERSRVRSWETLTIESRGSPLTLAGSKTLPGASASRRLPVRTATTTVRIPLWLKEFA